MEAIKPRVQIEGGLQVIVHERLGNSYRGPVLVGKAGSGRLYYRLWSGHQSLILMQSQSTDEDFNRFIECTRFLRSVDLPVPELLGFNGSSYQVLLQDLGDLTLLQHYSEEKTKAKSKYPQAIDLLIDFQKRARETILELPQVAHRNLGYLDLMWETEYFYDHFLSRYVRLDPVEKKKLFQFFSELALNSDRHYRTLIHRDFQSQNIMVKDETLWLIDYQGMRMGSLYYDLASLLWDPYTQLEVDFIKEMFDYYLDASGIAPSIDEWNRFLEAALQRVMQACGAYGYLSQIRDLRDFAQYLEPGWRRLRLIAELVDSVDSLDTHPLLAVLHKIDPERLKI